jgi:hypothetical protein
MRRRREESAGASVSLFPFLTVLICTMGVLIALLVLASKATEDQQARSRVERERQRIDQQQTLESERDELDIKYAAILQSRETLQADLAQARLRRSHLERELQDLEGRFDRAASQIKLLDANADLNVVAEADLAQRRQQIEQAEARLKQLAAELSPSPASYAIVAHPSLNGTLRRPIYLECIASGVVVQPCGLRIGVEELTPPVIPGNPLDTAVLAVREYWKKNELTGDGEPYPLLVVRPDGTRSYGLARRAMQSWDEEFGYELIEQQATLDFGPVDDSLRASLEATLKTARAEYAELRRMAAGATAPAMATTGPQGGLRAAATGGFVSLDGQRGASQSTAPRGGDTRESESQASAAEGLSSRTGPPAGATAMTGLERSSPESAGTPPGLAPLSRTRGTDWALPDHPANGTPYRRPIALRCSADAVLLDGGAPGSRIEIPWSATAANVGSLVTEIWRVIQTWGIAERNGFWKPELRFVIEPGGQATFEQIQIMLEGSGFDVMGTQYR